MTAVGAADAILAGLNPAQREAVCHTEGPLLVLAGAGSGKTRVIAHRIAYLVARGVDPRRILSMTFTNKAAGEMAQRVQALLEDRVARAPLVATFHATCVRILRAEIQHLGYPRGFVIYDEDDRLALVRELTKAAGLDDRVLSAQAIVARISRAKNALQSPDELAASTRSFRDEQVARLYARYAERLRAAGALDFDDLLGLTVRLWETHPDVLAYYRGLWRYILVDEYQDTNAAQYRLLRLLTAEHRNLCVVGDPDQSIYRFRGADLRNILDFERDFPDCRVVPLEQNYRSTGRILEIASAVIAHNRARKDKALWTENDRGEPGRLYRAWDEVDEAQWVARSVAALAAAGVSLDAIATLYRTNAQSRVLEDAFRGGGIPYHIVGSVRFYERKEVRDALAYLRLALNPDDDSAFRRAIGAPARGIGKSTLVRLDEAARQRGGSLTAAASGEIAGLGARAARVLGEFVALRERLAALTREPRPLGARVAGVIDASGLRAPLRREGTTEAEGRLENLEELCVAAEEFETREGQGDLAAFLDSIALLSDVDELTEPRAAVTLLTLHSAKGLEFPAVFLTGLEEGVFPHQKALDDTEALEEERRLAYVGLTRAKRWLFLSYASRRRLGGLGGMHEPSRFLLEMPEEALAPLRGPAGARAGGAPAGPEVAPPAPRTPGVLAPRQGVEESDLEPVPLRVGARVRHARWGEGLVVGVVRDGDDWLATVSFAAVGRKRLALRYAHLEEL